MELLNGDVLGMAGPGEKIAAFLTCTKMYDDDLADQVLDQEKNPEWQGECTKMVYAFPTNTKLWDEYAQVRASSLRAGRGIKDATAFYRQRREEMDTGVRVAWPARFNKDELSAIQHGARRWGWRWAGRLRRRVSKPSRRAPRCRTTGRRSRGTGASGFRRRTCRGS